ncbi:hypothetical protein A0H81_10281 [Grifola frondosa]|uniref:Uncharacterized protein n=1 Tax=Grifola frondosa TaxID=5627 RepID=A0A1C7LXV6_GRIFR|nr:hypothetical protein A0H81_10281 [Grifola frondosa]
MPMWIYRIYKLPGGTEPIKTFYIAPIVDLTPAISYLTWPGTAGRWRSKTLSAAAGSSVSVALEAGLQAAGTSLTKLGTGIISYFS